MLQLNNICKTFNSSTIDERRIFNNLNLHLKPKEFVTVIGGNGSGKSTLMNLIAGTMSTDQGSIILDGKNISDKPEYLRASLIGRVFQDPLKGTASNMKIYENLAIANNRGRKRSLRWGVNKDYLKIYEEILEPLNLGLENKIKLNGNILSGGQRQALTLIMATLQKPKLLLLDEHTAALDPKVSHIVLELTEKLILEGGLTALMITHNMNDAIRYGNRLIMMMNGQIVMDISNEEKSKLTVESILKKFAEA